MKFKNQKSHYLLVAIFLIGALYSGVILYNLSNDIERSSGRIDLNAINEISPVLNKAYLVIGVTLLIGIIALIRLAYYLNVNESRENLTATEKGTVATDETTADAEEKTFENYSETAKEILNSAKSVKDPVARYEKILSNVCMKIEASQGIFYKVKSEKGKRYIELLTSFAYSLPESETIKYEFGEGLAGQVAKEGKMVNIDDIPEGYIKIVSGLGVASPSHLAIFPVFVKDKVEAVVEIASFKKITEDDEKLISEVLNIEEKEAGVTKKTGQAKKSSTAKESEKK